MNKYKGKREKFSPDSIAFKSQLEYDVYNIIKTTYLLSDNSFQVLAHHKINLVNGNQLVLDIDFKTDFYLSGHGITKLIETKSGVSRGFLIQVSLLYSIHPTLAANLIVVFPDNNPEIIKFKKACKGIKSVTLSEFKQLISQDKL